LLFRQTLGPESLTQFRGWLPDVPEPSEPAPPAATGALGGFTLTQVLPFAALAVGGLVVAKVAS